MTPTQAPARPRALVYNYRVLRITATHIIYAFNRSEKVVEIRRMRRR